MLVTIHDEESKPVSLRLVQSGSQVQLVDASSRSGGIILTISNRGIDVAASYGGALPKGAAGRVDVVTHGG